MQKLCCVCTRQQFSASLDFCHQRSNPYLHQFSTISGGNCIKESLPSSRQDTVLGVTYKMIHIPQLFHGAQSGLYLFLHLPKTGISSVSTPTMPLCKVTSRIMPVYIFPEDINPRQEILLVYDSRKASMVSPLHPSSGIRIYKKD